MPEIDLGRADMALLSNLSGARVVIPRLQVFTPKRVREIVLVRFEGSSKRDAFRGEGIADTFPMTARYMDGEHDLLADLVNLFDQADDDPDGRILLRTHLSGAGPLNALEAIVVTDASQAWTGAGVVDFSWTAEAVAYSPGV